MAAFPHNASLLFADFYEEMLSLVYSLTCSQVTPKMWEAFPIIYELFKKDNVDYFTGQW